MGVKVAAIFKEGRGGKHCSRKEQLNFEGAPSLNTPPNQFAEPLTRCHQGSTVALLCRNPVKKFPANYASKETALQNREEVLSITTSRNPSLKKRSSKNPLYQSLGLSNANL